MIIKNMMGDVILYENQLRADLTSAKLVGLYLTGANLTGAKFMYADLSDVDFTGAIFKLGIESGIVTLFKKAMGSRFNYIGSIFSCGCFIGTVDMFEGFCMAVYGSDESQNYAAQIKWMRSIK